MSCSFNLINYIFNIINFNWHFAYLDLLYVGWAITFLWFSYFLYIFYFCSVMNFIKSLFNINNKK